MVGIAVRLPVPEARFGLKSTARTGTNSAPSIRQSQRHLPCSRPRSFSSPAESARLTNLAALSAKPQSRRATRQINIVRPPPACVRHCTWGTHWEDLQYHPLHTKRLISSIVWLAVCSFIYGLNRIAQNERHWT